LGSLPPVARKLDIPGAGGVEVARVSSSDGLLAWEVGSGQDGGDGSSGLAAGDGQDDNTGGESGHQL
jgi:hypothetical protein